jgi:DNA-binding MarR family transcriptional regulator
VIVSSVSKTESRRATGATSKRRGADGPASERRSADAATSEGPRATGATSKRRGPGEGVPAGPHPRRLDDREMAAWVPLIRLVHMLPHALDKKLREEVGISHAYYAMLVNLAGQPDRTLSMGELARLTGTSPSRLSHAISVLEKRGWVRRRPCETDRRIQYATLTDDGVAVLRRIAPTHVAQVRRLVFERLDDEQVEQLRVIGTTLLEGLEGLDVRDVDPPDVDPRDIDAGPERVLPEG